MLDVELAEKIIEKLTECTDYNINIMNERGIIVASTDKSRVGTFHEVAFEIINKKLDFKEVEAEDTFLGTKAGINMALEYKRNVIGVLGLTGEIEKIRPVVIVIKKMVETMLEYETQKEDALKRRTDKEHFINCLLYEDINKRELHNMAQALGYSEVTRVPILISFSDSVNLKEMSEKIKGGVGRSGREDIFVTSRDGKILIFKSYTEPIEGFFENYKYVIGEYLGRFLRHVAENEIDCKICVGSLQASMAHYKYGYQHCLWLEKSVSVPKRSIFFYDYLDEYLKHQLPFMELHKVFDVFAERYTDEFKKMYTEHIGALYENNYSMQESSKRLYIHKNTLAFRLDKIKNQLGLNPMQNARDRELVNYFYYYLRQLS
ncbi:CdaR family transcriptional regulator [Qiania dongpingensis]|uniref:Helix-turn-helix domain-containing protein n=1 Tax=Qiania dongpingensis TaxID=2763669 RepID=A0A7G9G7C1_9FIRM|nr:sugar diacid recognition domain-containing protein [Qiania dongpingensis]QNM06703.1 helix-turn-helix domain-containing protein [Qiania dongpingensis]